MIETKYYLNFLNLQKTISNFSWWYFWKPLRHIYIYLVFVTYKSKINVHKYSNMIHFYVHLSATYKCNYRLIFGCALSKLPFKFAYHCSNIIYNAT